MSATLTLTVCLKDGRVLQGIYPYFNALAFYAHALQQPDCVAARLEEPQE